ncbi:hypothetical protein C6A27_01140 [Streptococcus anginosus]|uniref:DUF2290 domain-containing protein n=1 Tax=Streptococcus anginosus TaxID=1328 RepID=A0A2T0G9G6_STRAP|nr:hypothetical protein [Streptococcus anginosus]PRT72681.1 hypothetical protein C6A27_01140 [Streptococcus anginosus]
MECKEFNISINQYIKKLVNYIQDRLSSPNWDDCIEIKFINKRGNKVVHSVDVNIQDRKFKHYENSNYVIKIAEKSYPKSDTKIFVKKYSYEIKNLENTRDFVRFDYKPYPNFPHFHINADENLWGNHLTYPDKTNINLENLDCFIALEIFNSFVAHPTEHILDKENNQRYLEKIKS